MMVDPPAVTVSDRPPCLTSITPTSSCVLKENEPKENADTTSNDQIQDSSSQPPCKTSWEPSNSNQDKQVDSMGGSGGEETSADEASREGYGSPASTDPAVTSVDTLSEEQGQTTVSDHGPVKRALRRRRANYREEEEDHEVSEDDTATSHDRRRPTRQAKKARIMMNSYNDDDFDDISRDECPAAQRPSTDRDRLNTLLSAMEKQSARGNTRVTSTPSLYPSMPTSADRSSQQQQPRLQSSLFMPGDMRSPNVPTSMTSLLPYQGFPMAGYPVYPTTLGGYPMYYGGGAELLGDYQSTAMAAGLSPQMQPRWLKSKPDSKPNTSSSMTSMPMTSQGLVPDPSPLYGMFTGLPSAVSQQTGSTKSNRSSSTSSGNNLSASGRAPRSMEQSMTFPQYGMAPLAQGGMMPYTAEGYPPMMMWRPEGGPRMMQQPPAHQDMGQMHQSNSGSYSMLRPPPPAPAPAADRRTPKELPPFEETRSGRWSAQEKTFANMIVRYFRAGVLDIPEGTTLRVYLSTRLKCNPMRVSKKFGGLGSLAYRQRSFPSPTNEEIDAAEAHLNALEARLLASEAEAQS